jgi:hypothetical protein
VSDQSILDHPVIKALIAEIPPTGSVWWSEDRVRWMRAFCHALALLRGDADDIRIEHVPVWPFAAVTTTQPSATLLPGKGNTW